ncbi:DNA damage-binding protein 1 [Cymbomonas tetramitiformis]|uniref:DNA damage-binding protein 1 n=1 Tax=Cymbomonas tetramitiformis TaxID=36881 RepID=A0AAE0FYK7_9CHLO|nr:DNA damage-binding protein 1 [Cymbomonas tetramitiformis]
MRTPPGPPCAGTLVTKATGDLQERVGRPNDSGQPGSFAAVSPLPEAATRCVARSRAPSLLDAPSVWQPVAAALALGTGCCDRHLKAPCLDKLLIGNVGTIKIGIIDPKIRLIGMHLYDGHFKVLPFDSKGDLLKEAYNIRLEELKVVHMAFLHDTAKPTIAVLYEDPKEQRHVKTYEVNLKEKEFNEGPWCQSHLDGGSSMIIPVPAPLGGVVIIGERTILYLNSPAEGEPRDKPYVKASPMRVTITKAFGKVDPDGSRWLLSDQQGDLHLMALHNDGHRVQGIKLEKLGTTSIASTISYLDNGVVFIGSNFGDSQLVKVNPQPDARGSYVDVLENFINLGPIVDLCVVDLERQGQGQVVTCSGAAKDGSLRIVRNGIGINEQATVDLPGIKGMWSLRSSGADVYDTFLVVTFISETRILAINVDETSSAELGETEIEGFDSDSQTLFCGNVLYDQLLQVTAGAVRLVSSASMQVVKTWSPPRGLQINVVSANKSQVLLGTSGGNLVYLEVGPSDLVEAHRVQLGPEKEISCLDISPLDSEAESSSLAVVGLWSMEVCLYRVPDFSMLAVESVGETVIPRSVLLCMFEGVPYLLAALGDGHLFNFVVDPETGTLSEKKKISLGCPLPSSPFAPAPPPHHSGEDRSP